MRPSQAQPQPAQAQHLITAALLRKKLKNFCASHSMQHSTSFMSLQYPASSKVPERPDQAGHLAERRRSHSREEATEICCAANDKSSATALPVQARCPPRQITHRVSKFGRAVGKGEPTQATAAAADLSFLTQLSEAVHFGVTLPMGRKREQILSYDP